MNTHTCTCACTYAPMHPCTHAPMHPCTYVHSHLCTHAPMYIWTYAHTQPRLTLATKPRDAHSMGTAISFPGSAPSTASLMGIPQMVDEELGTREGGGWWESLPSAPLHPCIHVPMHPCTYADTYHETLISSFHGLRIR